VSVAEVIVKLKVAHFMAHCVLAYICCLAARTFWQNCDKSERRVLCSRAKTVSISRSAVSVGVHSVSPWVIGVRCSFWQLFTALAASLFCSKRWTASVSAQETDVFRGMQPYTPRCSKTIALHHVACCPCHLSTCGRPAPTRIDTSPLILRMDYHLYSINKYRAEHQTVLHDILKCDAPSINDTIYYRLSHTGSEHWQFAVDLKCVY